MGLAHNRARNVQEKLPRKIPTDDGRCARLLLQEWQRKVEEENQISKLKKNPKKVVVEKFPGPTSHGGDKYVVVYKDENWMTTTKDKAVGASVWEQKNGKPYHARLSPFHVEAPKKNSKKKKS